MTNHRDNRIRAAVQEDEPGVTACVRAAYGHYLALLDKPPLPLLDNYSELIAHGQVSVLAQADEIIGVLVLQPGDESFLINNVAVHPAHQGKGLGTLLLNFAEAEALRQGYRSISLYTNVRMVKNQAIYAARGFVEQERRQVNGRSSVIMKKELG
jgi:GNAT superfamily N-acetyltransferase